MEKNFFGGRATSPSTLTQLNISSVPPIKPDFYDIINETINKDVPQPANQFMNIQKGGDKYYLKYMKYKSKYLKLKNLIK
jgi:hypothetical protein